MNSNTIKEDMIKSLLVLYPMMQIICRLDSASGTITFNMAVVRLWPMHILVLYTIFPNKKKQSSFCLFYISDIAVNLRHRLIGEVW